MPDYPTDAMIEAALDEIAPGWSEWPDTPREHILKIAERAILAAERAAWVAASTAPESVPLLASTRQGTSVVWKDARWPGELCLDETGEAVEARLVRPLPLGPDQEGGR